MMLDFYGLREQPFGVAPDPRYLYLSPTHREALASLAYGIEVGRGFMALVATPGMGKTTLLFQVLQQVGKSARTVFLFRTPSDSRELLEALMSDLEIDYQGQSLAWMSERLNQVLMEEARRGRRVIVVVDEAQNLSEPVLETVRQWSNFETSSAKLMQIILAGQPALADRLLSPNLVQLRQRVSILARLEPLSPQEVADYIRHRLGVAGYDGPPLLTRKALELITAESKGIPRNINNLCFNALSLGYALQRRKLDADIVAEAAGDLDMVPLSSESRRADLDSILLEGQTVRAGSPEASGRNPPEREPRPPSWTTSAIMVAIGLVLLGSFWLGKHGVNSRSLDYLFTSARPIMIPVANPADARAAGSSEDSPAASHRSGQQTDTAAKSDQPTGVSTASGPSSAAQNSPSASTSPIPLQLSPPPGSAQFDIPEAEAGNDSPSEAERQDRGKNSSVAQEALPASKGRKGLEASKRRSKSTGRSSSGSILSARELGSRPATVAYRPPPDLSTGEINITTDPPGLSVLIGGAMCGRSPVQKLLSAGSHTYRVFPPRGGAPGNGIFEVKPAAVVRISLKWPSRSASALAGAAPNGVSSAR